MKKLIVTLLIALMGLGCQSCGATNVEPNIREEPGAVDCPAFCDRMVELGKTDPTCLDYLLLEPDAGDDAGTGQCVAWCVNAQKNSVQLNPGCMAKVSRCDQVDCASRISPSECTNLDIVCK